MKHWNKVTVSFCSLALLAGCTHAVHADGTLTADTPTKERYSIFSPGDTVTIAFEATRPTDTSADTLDWTVEDYLGKTKQSGKIPVTAGEADWKSTLTLPPLPAGYYALHAHLEHSGLSLGKLGSRPEDMSTFGILPDITPLPLAHVDDSRFGIQGSNFIQSNRVGAGDYVDPLITLLGAHWNYLGRQWQTLEKDQPGQFIPKQHATDLQGISWMSHDHIAAFTNIDGFPTWALDRPLSSSPTSDAGDLARAYPPKDQRQYAQFLTKVGMEQPIRRQTLFPTQLHDYYQVTWEPDGHWKDNDQDFITMYDTAYQALHQSDPQAIVMGPTYSLLSYGQGKPYGIDRLATMLPLGLAHDLDGITFHGYYKGQGPYQAAPKGVLATPENGNLISSMRQLHHLMQTYLKPTAKLFQTEWGLDYRTDYDHVTPSLLHQQAALVTRGHLLFLGEGADATFFFYTADGPKEPGYGLCFNLSMDKTPTGATDVSPKPVYMALAALTRLLEGTKTVGPISGTASADQVKDKDVYGYAFQRADQTLAALWAPGGSKKITVHVGADQVKMYDMMGNETTLSASQGHLSLTVGQEPVYLLGVTQPAVE